MGYLGKTGLWTSAGTVWRTAQSVWVSILQIWSNFECEDLFAADFVHHVIFDMSYFIFGLLVRLGTA